MKTIFVVGFCCLFATAGRAEMPRLFRERAFNAATVAAAVNHFVALGEEKAVRELTRLAPEHDFQRDKAGGGWSRAERVGWVCRILFLPPGHDPLRPPGYGMNSLPFKTMPLGRWPLYPVAQSGASFFVLSEGYIVAGLPEAPKSYLAYCRAEGVFRQRPVAVPTRARAEKDGRALRQSPAWTAIRWKDRGEGFRYEMREGETWRFIQAQAEVRK